MLIGGIDEVGCGCLCGPVVAAITVFDLDKPPFDGIRDSKKMTAARRDAMFRRIYEQAVDVGVGFVSAYEIDRRNILQARMRDMLDALYMTSVRPEKLYIDGTEKPHFIEDGMKVIAMAKADDKIWQVSAASIVAKVVRDEHMRKLALEYPNYGWERNAGYGTPEHEQAIRKLGLTPEHRLTFCKKF